MNRVCELFGIEIPILQAPTGSIAGPELAAAVSEAGGLGSLGLTWTPPEDAAECVRHVRSLTERPFLVNFALAFEPVSLIPALAAGAPIVTFSWGDASAWIPTVRRYGAKVGIQVGNADGARRAAELEIDFLICQGVEAGGHVQSTQSLESLLPSVLEAAGGMPVVAAGGISDGADIARALRPGADGVMLGTRFVATLESRAHEEYKRRLVESACGESALTICFDGGWPHSPHRVLRNSTLESWESAGCPAPGHRPGEDESVAVSASGEPILRYEDTAPRIGMTGNIEALAHYAGTGLDSIRDIPSAAELVRRLWEEARRLLEIAS